MGNSDTVHIVTGDMDRVVEYQCRDIQQFDLEFQSPRIKTFGSYKDGAVVRIGN